MRTIRQEISGMLSVEEYTAGEIANMLGLKYKEVFDHLEHIRKSAASQKKRMTIIPAKCRACGFVFKDRSKFQTPSRCPKCKKEQIQEPRFRID